MSKKLIASYDDVITAWRAEPESTAMKALRFALAPVPFLLAEALPGLVGYLKGQGQVSKDDAENLQTAGTDLDLVEIHEEGVGCQNFTIDRSDHKTMKPLERTQLKAQVRMDFDHDYAGAMKLKFSGNTFFLQVEVEDEDR